jgi:hypothetical protein
MPMKRGTVPMPQIVAVAIGFGGRFLAGCRARPDRNESGLPSNPATTVVSRGGGGD